GQLAGDEGAVFGAELGDVLSATAIDDAEERAHQGAVGDEERVASVVDRLEPGDRSAGDVEETLAARRSLPPRPQAHVETARTQVLDRVTRPMAPAPLPQSGARKQRRRMALEDELGRLPRPPHVRTVRTNEGERLQRGANAARLLAPGLRQTDVAAPREPLSGVGFTLCMTEERPSDHRESIAEGEETRNHGIGAPAGAGCKRRGGRWCGAMSLHSGPAGTSELVIRP